MKKIVLSAAAIFVFGQSSFGQDWSLFGNVVSNTLSPSHFLGSTNNAHLDFRTNSIQRMRILNTGQVGIGTSSPAAGLHVYSSTEPLSMKIQTMGTSNADLAFQSATNQSDILHYNSTGGLTGILRFNSSTTGASMGFVSYQTGTGVEHFKVTEIGNVDIGTNGAEHPDEKMHILNTEKKIGLCINNTQTNNNNYGLKCIVNNMTTKALAVTGVSDGKDVFRVLGNGVVWCTELNVDVKGDFPDYVFDKDYKLLPLDDLKEFVETEKHLPNVPTAKEVAENGIAVSKMAVVQTEKIEELTLYVLQLNETMKKLQTQNEALQKRIAELESK